MITGAPERIWLVVGDVEDEPIPFGELSEVSWCADSVYSQDIEYVRADLVAELRAGVQNLFDVKGRHHTEQAMERLRALLAVPAKQKSKATGHSTDETPPNGTV